MQLDTSYSLFNQLDNARLAGTQGQFYKDVTISTATFGLSNQMQAGFDYYYGNIDEDSFSQIVGGTGLLQITPFLSGRPLRVPVDPAYLAKVLKGHKAGQGFPGAIDMATKKTLICPSSLSSPLPKGWVPWHQGHLYVSKALGGGPHLGYTVILQSDGSLNIKFYSGGLNQAFPNNTVPSPLQQTIINTVSAATGRTVNP